MKEAENRVQVPVLFGFTTYFSSKHNFNLKETFIANKAPCTPSGLLTSRGSFMLPGYYPTCPWSHHFLVLPKGFFCSFSSVCKLPFSLSFLLAHDLASFVTEDMKALRGGLRPALPASTHRHESVSTLIPLLL